MKDEIRWLAGTAVIVRTEGKKPLEGKLSEDCKVWHSFATVMCRRREYSVWAGDIEAVSSGDSGKEKG